MKKLKNLIEICGGIVTVWSIMNPHFPLEYENLYSFLVRAIIAVLTFRFTTLTAKNKKYIFLFILLAIVMLFSQFFVGNFGWRMIIMSFGNTLPIFCASMAYYFAQDWLKKQQQMQELETKSIQSELSMLKNQINPHFLFNTLNNIDSLIKKNPDRASQSIVELSDIMRYMIYETNVKKVPLAKELEYIDNYLALQKLQYFNDDLVAYSVVGSAENIEVAPMLFIPFIENAFKHCTDKETRHAIRFSFAIDAHKIRFDAVNIADPNRTISKDETSGIGLETVKRRLEILYPKRYSLAIDEKNDLFCVSLEIKNDD